MAKELRTGISCNGGTASIAILEMQDDAIELKHLDELRRTRADQFWFLDILESVDKKMLGKLSLVSVAVETGKVQLHAFPMDSSLGQVEMNEHVGWELSNYISNYRPKDYITDLKTMRTNAREQVFDVLAVSMEKSFVFDLQEHLKNKKLNLGTIDVEYFAAEEALLHSHPETKTRQCAIIGLSDERVDVGILSNSRLINYRYHPVQEADDALPFLHEIIEEFSLESLYAHGTGMSFEAQKVFRKEFGQKFMLLNPFRRMRISPAVSQFSTYLGNEYRFSCCVGSALRSVK